MRIAYKFPIAIFDTTIGDICFYMDVGQYVLSLIINSIYKQLYYHDVNEPTIEIIIYIQYLLYDQKYFNPH